MRFETCHHLDPRTLQRILDLVDAITRIDGRSPVGEHKYAHLAVGAEGWTGVLAYDDDELVGYAHTLWTDETVPRVRVEVVVHPDVREDGATTRSLIERAKGVLADAGGGVMWLWAHDVEDPRSTVAHQMGFAIQRELAFMCRDLRERPDVPDGPPEILVRAYRPGVDDAAFLQVNNAAFIGHPENGDWDEREFKERRAREWFDPAGLFMAWRRRADHSDRSGVGDDADEDDLEPVAFHWTKWHGHTADDVPAHDPVGEVYVLAVHPDAQGLGLGRLLLQRGLAHLWDAGCRRAILYVDRASRGAMRLYASAGFRVAYSEVCYEITVSA